MKIYGNVFWHGRFVKGTLVIKDGYVEDFRKGRDYDIRGTVVPTFINMHTHIGDFACSEEPPDDILDAVGPNGFKYRILRNRSKVYSGMRRALRYMEKEGISHFVDFRENGFRGVHLLKEAAKGFRIMPVIYGREIGEGISGIGLSSVSDYPPEYIRNMERRARANGLGFAVHASERIREDIDFILSLNPDFLVHMLEATDDDLEKVKNKDVPIVITPRSNLFFGKIPNIPRFLRFGLTLALGTDNGMFSLPSIFREMEIAYKISKIYGHVAPEDILKMTTENPRKILGIDDNFTGKRARFVVFRRFMSAYEIVTRANPFDIKMIIF